jgi:hypothetical protein
VGDGEVLVQCQDMTISRAEFLRSLPAAVDNVPFAVDAAAGVRSLDPARRWRITLTPLPDLRLGSIRLPRLQVAILLTGYDDAEATRFLERFELYYRRAGG